MSDFNMPPGVSVSDIPGNRPEDLAEEAFWEKLAEMCCDLPESIWDAPGVRTLVESARDLAWAAGYAEGQADEAMAEAARQSESAKPQPQASEPTDPQLTADEARLCLTWLPDNERDRDLRPKLMRIAGLA